MQLTLKLFFMLQKQSAATHQFVAATAPDRMRLLTEKQNMQKNQGFGIGEAFLTSDRIYCQGNFNDFT